jgi:exopolysaccharide biosynthesis polyprenyl glycosylphosphotransferase
VADLLLLAGKERIEPSATVHSYPIGPHHPEQTVHRPAAVRATSGREDRHAPVPVLRRMSSVRAGDRVVTGDPFIGRRPFIVGLPVAKRVCDVVGAAIALVLFSPVLAAAAVAVKLSSPGPVLFIQRRAGLGGRPFSMYKFRSMYVDAEAGKARLTHLNERDGPAFKIRNDPRITPVGRFLRRSSIDELPQFLNVLKGDMSLVGPRPPTVYEVAKYRNWYCRRLDVTPGITCIWQVRGRADVTFETWMRMDIQYIRRYSLWQDLRLLAATIPAVILGRGAH